MCNNHLDRYKRIMFMNEWERTISNWERKSSELVNEKIRYLQGRANHIGGRVAA
jgi:hypothetical protein